MNQIWKLEEAFEAGNRELLTQWSKSHEYPWANLADILICLLDRQYEIALNHIEQLWCPLELPLEVSVFLIDFGVAIGDANFKDGIREKWMLRWNHLGDIRRSLYAEETYFFQMGVGYFHQMAFTDARRYWEQSLKRSQNTKHIRGQIRSYFHLGLLCKETGQGRKALDLFESAESILLTYPSTRYQERIDVQKKILSRLNNNSCFAISEIQLNLFDLIMKSKRNAARKMCLLYCKLRRQEGRNWKAQSEYAALALVLMAFRKEKSLENILLATEDKLVRLSILESLSAYSKSFGLEFRYQQDLDFLRHFLVSEKSISYQNNSRDVEALIHLLKLHSEGITKEQICTQIWNYQYDPIIHDSRIYKLVQKARKFLGSKNGIVNLYGDYYRLSTLWR